MNHKHFKILKTCDGMFVIYFKFFKLLYLYRLKIPTLKLKTI